MEPTDLKSNRDARLPLHISIYDPTCSTTLSVLAETELERIVCPTSPKPARSR
jgi:hypothetical protein